MYKFDKFNKAAAHSEDDSDTKKKKKFDFQHINFEDNNGDIDPIQMNDTDGAAFFNNTDGISFSFKKKNNE